MEYSNAQILAAVVSEWARPAISQIAAGRLMRLPMLQSLQATVSSMGLVSGSYSLQADIEPVLQPVVNAMLTPVLSRYLSALPDEGIPQMAHDVVEQMRHLLHTLAGHQPGLHHTRVQRHARHLGHALGRSIGQRHCPHRLL